MGRPELSRGAKLSWALSKPRQVLLPLEPPSPGPPMPKLSSRKREGGLTELSRAPSFLGADPRVCVKSCSPWNHFTQTLLCLAIPLGTA